MNIDLTHKNALVCGSTGGIGKASAIALSKAGANITLVARNKEKLNDVLDTLDTSANQSHNFLVADFSNPKVLKDKITQAAQEKTYHILLNNTGGPPGGKISEASTEAFKDAFQQHLICNHILVQAIVKGMKNEGYGRIINIISTSVKQPLDGLGVSNTIRGAVANWSKTMANELGEFGITVNNVLPGATATGRLSEIIKNKAEKTGKPENEIEQSMQANVPAKRFAQPEELANAVVFLASKEAAYINGINLPVDGGRTKSL